jgi:hypothetical protein
MLIRLESLGLRFVPNHDDKCMEKHTPIHRSFCDNRFLGSDVRIRLDKHCDFTAAPQSAADVRKPRNDGRNSA